MHDTSVETIREFLQQTDYIQDNCKILEPSAGKGNFINEIRRHCLTSYIHAVEIQTDLINSYTNADLVSLTNFLQMHPSSYEKYDVIIGNPPYNKDTEKFIEHSMKFLKEDGKLIFLLRMSLLVGLKRYKFLQEYHPSIVYILPRRPFTDAYVDVSGYVWVVWNNPISSEPTILNWLRPIDY